MDVVKYLFYWIFYFYFFLLDFPCHLVAHHHFASLAKINYFIVVRALKM